MLLVLFLTAAVSLGLPGQPEQEDVASNILVWYDFEEEAVETGPYTLMVFDGAKGSVSLSSLYRYNGYRSVEIKDFAGDESFAELQGFFADKWHGYLFIHFAMLVAETEEPMNIAFAGNAHFSMREHGLAIWLKLRRGILYQVSSGEDVPLFDVEPFTWYVVDLAYDVDAGTYDLLVHAEGQDEPVVALTEQVNAVGIPGSQLRKYSFIGDLPGRDASNAWFYIDDIAITNDIPVSETPMVAPGRRMLFVDMYDRYLARLYEKPGCAPVLGYEDFGFSSADLSELAAAGGMALLEDADAPSKSTQELTPFLRRRLSAMRDWRRGCDAPPEALDLFRQARDKAPEGKIYAMSEVLALARAKKWPEADALLLDIYPLWIDDPRFPALAATIGIARQDLDSADQWLAMSAESPAKAFTHKLVKRLWSGDIGPGLADALKSEFPAEWPELISAALSADLRFYVFLWQKRWNDARLYAERMESLFERMQLPTGRWLERQGDAAFYAGDLLAAQASYETSAGSREDAESVWLKLSDVHFALGNLELERVYREKIYGSLR